LAALAARVVLNLVEAAVVSATHTGFGWLGLPLAVVSVAVPAATGGFVGTWFDRASGLRDALGIGLTLVALQAVLGVLLPGMVDFGWSFLVFAAVVVLSALLGGFLAGRGPNKRFQRAAQGVR